VHPNDNFNDGALGSSWGIIGSGVVETNSRLEITPPAGGATVGLRWLQSANLLNTPFRFKIPNAWGSLSFDAIHAGVRLVDRTTGNYAEFCIRTSWAGSGSSRHHMANGSMVADAGISTSEDSIEFRVTAKTGSQYAAGGKYATLEKTANGSDWVECATTMFLASDQQWADGWNPEDLEVQLIARRSSGEGTIFFDDAGLASGDGGGAQASPAVLQLASNAGTATVAPGGSTFTPISVALSNGGDLPLGTLSVSVVSGDASLVVLSVDSDSLDMSAGAGVGALADGSTTPVTVRVTSQNGGAQDYALSIQKQSSTAVPGDTFQWAVTGRNGNGGAVAQVPQFTTSNPGVATVSASGLVTAMDPGTATITATYLSGKTATLAVTVNARP
jgi:hypothetical protein